MRPSTEPSWALSDNEKTRELQFTSLNIMGKPRLNPKPYWGFPLSRDDYSARALDL